MKMDRLRWLLVVLAGLALLVLWDDVPPGAGASVVPAAAATRDGIPVETAVFIRAVQPRAPLPAPGRDPFVLDAPIAEPEPRQAVLPAPTFAAPLPFRVIGKQHDEDAGWSVFLARGEQTWVVRAGDPLGDDYRVAAIQPPLLTLQHLRNKTRRTLDIGETRE